MQRVQLIRSQLDTLKLSNKSANNQTVTITDNRSGKEKLKLIFSGKTYTYTLFDGAIRASDLEKIKDSEGNPLRSYDPAYMNTINCVNFILKI